MKILFIVKYVEEFVNYMQACIKREPSATLHCVQQVRIYLMICLRNFNQYTFISENAHTL